MHESACVCVCERERERLIEKAMTNALGRVHWRQSMRAIRPAIGRRVYAKVASLHLINISTARNITAARFKNRLTFYTESPRVVTKCIRPSRDENNNCAID